MRGLRKIAAMVFAAAMVFSISVSATAAITTEDVDNKTGAAESFDQNRAKTTVSVIHPTETTQLSATVPLNITFAIYDNGKFECPTNYKIVNKGTEYIRVANITVAMLDPDYSLVKNESPDENQIYLTLIGGKGYVQDKVVLESAPGIDKEQSYNKSSDAWSIGGDESISIMFDGKVNGLKDAWKNKEAELFTITYTIEALA